MFMSSKRKFTLVLAALFALTASLALAAEPKLVVAEPVKDFGTVPKGKMLDAAFVISNQGTADLQILSANPACGCTVAEFDRVIKPGQSGKVMAHVDTGQFMDAIAKGITLQTNDPKAPTYQLTVKAFVKSYVDAFPAGFVRYQNFLVGDTQTQTVKIHSADEAAFEITGVGALPPYLKVDFAKITDPSERAPGGREGQNQFKVNVTLTGPDAPVGPLNDAIVLKTNSKNQPEYTLRVSGLVRPTYAVFPTVVNFGTVAAADAALELAVNSGLPADRAAGLQVTKVESSLPFLKTSVAPGKAAGQFSVSAQIDPAAPSGDFSGTLRIHTNDKIKPVTEIPVRGTIQVTQ
jgi:hypothetical protein